jgi:SAM-dependent methyltransferase
MTALETVACCACAGAQCAPFIEAQDDLGGRPGRFRFVSCVKCGLVYQNPRLPLEAIKDWYDDEYIAHRKKTDWGVLTRAYNYAMERHDRRKLDLVRRYTRLDARSHALDIGCGAGTFLAMLRTEQRCQVTGVDFKDLSHLPWMGSIDFRCGLFTEQRFSDRRFELITMWHFLEHDYEPRRTLAAARELLTQDGRLIIEVPKLDSVSFRLFQERWPGLQAPQHTALYSHATLRSMATQEGLEIVEHLPYGAFPAYFYLFTGVAFKLLRGRGLNLSRAIYPYFLGELLLAPLLAFEKRLNLAMQTIVLRRPS